MTTDDPKIWAALISGILALIGTVYVAILNYISREKQDATAKDLEVLKSRLQTERDERLARQEAEKIVSKFRDPLLKSGLRPAKPDIQYPGAKISTLQIHEGFRAGEGIRSREHGIPGRAVSRMDRTHAPGNTIHRSGQR